MKVEKSEEKPLYLCKAFIIDMFGRKYMLHLWLKPYQKIAWHRKNDGLKGKLFQVTKYE